MGSLSRRSFAVRDSLVPRFVGPANTTISSGTLRVQSDSRGGEAVVDNFDDDYMVQVWLGSVDQTSEIWFRYRDSNNGYMFQYDKPAKTAMKLYVVENGQRTQLWSGTYSILANPNLKIKVSGTSLKVWYDGTLKANVTNSVHAAGRVAFAGLGDSTSDNLKIGQATFLDHAS